MTLSRPMSAYLLNSIRHFSTNFIKCTALTAFLLLGCKDDAEEAIKPRVRLNADAGADQTVILGTEVTLDGSASKGENASGFQYAWTMKHKPSGSTVSIEEASAPVTRMSPDKTGLYTISLTISREGVTDTDIVEVIVTRTDDPEEPQTVILSEDILQDRTLPDIFSDPVQPDYIVSADLRVSATLTVEPGVLITFEENKGLSMISGGALIAKGTAAQPITFTGIEKRQGYWKGLLIATNSDLNQLEHTIVEYGGSSEHFDSPRTNVSVPGDAISGSTLKISNTIVRGSGGMGLYVGGMSYLNEFSNVTLTGNASTAIYCSPRNLSRIDAATVFSGNGFNGIETGGVLHEGAPVVWNALTSGEYRITSDLSISSQLELAAGSIFKIAKSVMINVAPLGQVVAQGTAQAPVVLQGVSTVAENAWRGILLQSGNDNVFNHTLIANAGFSPLPGITTGPTIIGATAGARVTVNNSRIEKSLGWGIVLEPGAYYNADIHATNTFSLLTSGAVKFPEQQQNESITGEWVDYESFVGGRLTINENFYNAGTGQWFEGADHPWVMNPRSGLGLKIDESGNYIWIIAMMHSPMTECFTYSAEYFTGNVTASGDVLNFVEYSWRSKYFNSCSPDENMDFSPEVGQMQLPYEIGKEFHPGSGEEYWVLSITAGGDTFKLYKK